MYMYKWCHMYHIIILMGTLHVYVLRECEGGGNADVGSGGGMVAVSAYMGWCTWFRCFV